MLIHGTTSVHAISLRSLAMKDWWQFESQARVSLDMCIQFPVLNLQQVDCRLRLKMKQSSEATANLLNFHSWDRVWVKPNWRHCKQFSKKTTALHLERLRSRWSKFSSIMQMSVACLAVSAFRIFTYLSKMDLTPICAHFRRGRLREIVKFNFVKN